MPSPVPVFEIYITPKFSCILDDDKLEIRKPAVPYMANKQWLSRRGYREKIVIPGIEI